MANCVSINEAGYLIQSSQSSCDFVLMTQDEYNALSVENILNLMDMYFKFDVALATQISGAFLISFLGAHYLGRFVRTIGRHS